ncbi:DUF4192 domain-containing protein [Mycolicibacterium komossense]|uniref:DUF4192 domain-containing protein n=1 Tax=Mycolicibacterium komossense TaxID=1779 RepID=A0ABT3CHF9_9MYCO|nr:DUF4192 domain-containing protein [Mycolicibacterium komossense]MCV7228887.1 DUF4192 domain-containing protein [Mycolicibacterium komossense]
MTRHYREFSTNRPGALIAAIPAVLGFTPEQSLVLVSIESGGLGAVLRVDLSPTLVEGLHELIEVIDAEQPDAVVAVIVDDKGAACPMCNEEHRALCDALIEALSGSGIELWAAHVVDHIGLGGTWHCVDGCGSRGAVDDPKASPLAAAAVLDGRRLYATRSDLQAVIAADHTAAPSALTDAIAARQGDDERRRWEDSAGAARRDVEAALAAVKRVAGGALLAEAEIVALGSALADAQVRDTMYAVAVGESAGAAESLWATLARRLPAPWRVEPLVLLAFSAYARGDGPLAGVSLEEALRCAPKHRMARMLDDALHSAMRPEQIRELARTGYRRAAELGVQLPPRQSFDQRAV